MKRWDIRDRDTDQIVRRTSSVYTVLRYSQKHYSIEEAS